MAYSSPLTTATPTLLRAVLIGWQRSQKFPIGSNTSTTFKESPKERNTDCQLRTNQISSVTSHQQHTWAVESSHSVDESCDGRAAPLSGLEGGQVRTTLRHQVEIFGFIHQISDRKHSRTRTRTRIRARVRDVIFVHSDTFFVSPAFMAAAYKFVLLDSVWQELRSTQRKSDLWQQFWQQRLPAVLVMMDPGQHCLKHLHRYNTCNTPLTRAEVQHTQQVCFSLMLSGETSHLLLCFNIEFVTADQLQHLLRPQTQKLLGHRNLHKVLMEETVGRVVQSRTHHGLCKLTHTQTVLRM